MKVRDAFANAYRELRDAVLPQYQHIQSHCSSFLGRILLIPVEVVKYRQVVEKRWQLQPFSPSSSASSSSANEDTQQQQPSHSVTEQRQSTTQQPADDKHVSHSHTLASQLQGQGCTTSVGSGAMNLRGRGTTATAPPPFRPGNPALCGSCPLVTPY